MTKIASTSGKRSRSCVRESTRSGTTASSCRTSIWRPRRILSTRVHAGSYAQVQSQRQRQARNLRLSGRICAALRRHQTGAAATARRTCRRSFKTTNGPSDLACSEEAAPGLVIQGASNCRQLVSGHKFTVAATLQRRRPVRAHKPVAHSARQAATTAPTRASFNYDESVSPASPLRCPSGPNG